MSRNPIQMQKGLSLTAFLERYGTEAKCETAVRAWRWPDGFVCPQCGGREHAIVGARRLYHCHGCRKQTSLKANTIFQRTLLPLTTWFQAMYLLTQSKNSISGLELARQLGVRPDTASLMRHKLMTVMEAFVAAVQTTDSGHPVRLLLHVVRTHDSEAIEAMARQHLEPTARIVSDGLGCFRAVTRVGCAHEPIVAAKTGWSEKIPAFRWVNTVVGNLKTAMVGTMKHVAKRYVPRYFAEFQYRFNRRYDLPEMLDRLGAIASKAPPRPRKLLKIAYEAG
jgi:transposase-like protein